jgi:hypothetical protein
MDASQYKDYVLTLLFMKCVSDKPSGAVDARDAAGQTVARSGTRARQIGGDAPMIIKRPASRIQQGNLLPYATSLRVADLRVRDFYRIDTLDAEEGVGYQRLPTKPGPSGSLSIFQTATRLTKHFSRHLFS